MVYWSFTLRDDLRSFSLRHGPTKDLEDTATAKDFFNQFIDDDYLKAAPSKLRLSGARGDRCRKAIAEFLVKTRQI